MIEPFGAPIPGVPPIATIVRPGPGAAAVNYLTRSNPERRFVRYGNVASNATPICVPPALYSSSPMSLGDTASE